MSTEKRQLLREGCRLIEQFCRLNNLELPDVRLVRAQRWKFSACAYYRPVYIALCIDRCESKGRAAPGAWSWPGYVIDRTPYGVLAHELGHHVDYHRSTVRGGYFGNYSRDLRAASGEEKLTGYRPNDAEWFAEIFRLYVTNPDLLRRLRPRAYAYLCRDFSPVVEEPWDRVLETAPQRTKDQALKKIEQAQGQTLRML